MSVSNRSPNSKSRCVFALIYCLFTLARVAGGEAPENGQFRFIEFMTGSWKCRTTDRDGRLLWEPNIASFESTLNGTACCEKIAGHKLLITVYQVTSENTIVKVDIYSRPLPLGATTTVLVGKYDKTSRTIAWSDKDGKLVHTWRIIGHDAIAVELPPGAKGDARDQLMLWTRIPLKDRQDKTPDKAIHDSGSDHQSTQKGDRDAARQ